MADNTYSSLKESGFAPEQELCVRKILATSELGKRYHLNIKGEKLSSDVQYKSLILRRQRFHLVQFCYAVGD